MIPSIPRSSLPYAVISDGKYTGNLYVLYKLLK